MYAIMGATGQTGGAALAELRRRGAPVRAIARNPEGLRRQGIEAVRADGTDPESLAAAFSDADAVYVLDAPPPDTRDVVAEAAWWSAAIAGAVRRAKVRHVVALSSQGAHLAQGTGIVRVLHEFEAALRGTGASVAFVRATYFMENWAPLLGLAREQGVLPSFRRPLDAASEMVSVADIGMAAADCLIDRRDGERVVNLVGPERYSPQDAARLLSEALGRPVQPVATPREAWGAAMAGAGLSPSYAAELAGMYDALNAAGIPFEGGVGEQRRGAVTLRAALQAMLAR